LTAKQLGYLKGLHSMLPRELKMEARMEPKEEMKLPPALAMRFHSQAALPKHGPWPLMLPRWT
jgi:hypothetical protein